MIINGGLIFTGTMSYNGSQLNLEYIADDYRNGLTLTKGYIGGGYISNAGWTVVTTIQNATDAWGTSSNAALGTAHRYGNAFSSHINGYILYGDGSYRINKRMPFSTESISDIANRSYGNYPCVVQHGVGYNNDGSFYGTRGYTLANDSSNYEKFTFPSETWTTASDANIYTGNQTYCEAWFDKHYGWSLANDGVTRRYTFSSETWATRSPSPNYTQTLSYWGKGLSTKDAKSYVHAGSTVYAFMKFMHLTESYVTNPYSQTLDNDEQPTVMGQSHGYFAGGYNGVQNAHTDRVESNTDSVIKILDAPRALSAGAPMWSGY
jgi:hypothetical protein